MFDIDAFVLGVGAWFKLSRAMSRAIELGNPASQARTHG